MKGRLFLCLWRFPCNIHVKLETRAGIFLACIQNWLDLSNVKLDPILADESHCGDGFFTFFWSFGEKVISLHGFCNLRQTIDITYIL